MANLPFNYFGNLYYPIGVVPAPAMIAPNSIMVPLLLGSRKKKHTAKKADHKPKNSRRQRHSKRHRCNGFCPHWCKGYTRANCRVLGCTENHYSHYCKKCETPNVSHFSRNCYKHKQKSGSSNDHWSGCTSARHGCFYWDNLLLHANACLWCRNRCHKERTKRGYG